MTWVEADGICQARVPSPPFIYRAGPARGQGQIIALLMLKGLRGLEGRPRSERRETQPQNSKEAPALSQHPPQSQMGVARAQKEAVNSPR